MLKNTMERYGLVSRGLHWLMALLIIGLFVVGLLMGELEKGSDLRSQVYGLHKASGILVLELLVLRLLWLAYTRPPQLPAMFSSMEKLLSSGVKWLLYGLMLAIPLSGWLMSNSGGHAVSFYGLFNLPMLAGENHALHEAAEEVHEITAWVAILLTTVHVLGALKHRFFNLDPQADVLKRML